jgi:hypothetical protein
MKQIGSGKIVWSDATIDQLRQNLASYEIEDYEGSGDEEEFQEFLEIEDDSVPEESDPTEPDPITIIVVPPPEIDIDFPWPISVKSSSFIVSGNRTTGVDTVLTWDDVLLADDYEVRITGL